MSVILIYEYGKSDTLSSRRKVVVRGPGRPDFRLVYRSTIRVDEVRGSGRTA